SCLRLYSLFFVVDGSFQEDIQTAGVGVIVFDSEGHAIDGRAGQLFCRTPSVAEAYAVLTAVQVARDMNMQVVVKTDCLEVVQAMKAPRDERPWEIAAVIANIDAIIQMNPHIMVVHCKRTEISRAHDVANRARLGTLVPNWCANM
ncbi:hypothetical protein LINPERHAP2_LOCUS29301, partial [Linum perenne]